MNLETVLTHYIAAALWSTTDESTPEGGEPMDDNYDRQDLSRSCLFAMRRDCKAFIEAADEADLLEEYPDTEEQFGHDFWLTRCGHGVGFWDRGYGDLGSRLTELSKAEGNVDIYVGDGNKIYQMGDEMIDNRDNLIEAFEESIRGNGFTSSNEPGAVATTLERAADMDYDQLNQQWADWVDQMIQSGEVVEEAKNWDWEEE